MSIHKFIHILILGLSISRISAAAVHYVHKHEDLFMEEEVQVGFRVGPTMTRYTPIEVTRRDGTKTKVNVETTVGVTAGLATKLVYSIPKIEFDILWNWRRWPSTGESLQLVSMPVLLKLPLEPIKFLEFEFGVGYQPDFTISAPTPHRKVYSGLLASGGVSFDFMTWIMEIEGRYNHGLNETSDGFSGGKYREIQLLLGSLWHF